jgi:hypothetical protein
VINGDNSDDNLLWDNEAKKWLVNITYYAIFSPSAKAKTYISTSYIVDFKLWAPASPASAWSERKLKVWGLHERK